MKTNEPKSLSEACENAIKFLWNLKTHESMKIALELQVAVYEQEQRIKSLMERFGI